VDDIVYVISDDDDEPMLSSVISVMIEMKSGYYAPWTTSGRKREHEFIEIILFSIV
jgi:hypothetical protein